jgi:MFS family permease
VGSLVPTAALAVVLLVLVVAAGPLWGAVRSALGDRGDLLAPLVVAVAVALWLVGLVLIGLVCAWRGAVWTVQVAGTFGGVTSTRPGELEVGGTSGTLSDLRPPEAGSDRGAS